MPTMVDDRIFTSRQYRYHEMNPVMHEGKTHWKMRSQNDAPTAVRLSTTPAGISSITSMKVRVMKAKLVMTSAVKPTPVPTPREERG